MAPVADHLSFETLTDVEHAATERCRILNGDQLKLGTTVHWWPKPIAPT
jgi:hypothetical protein